MLTTRKHVSKTLIALAVAVAAGSLLASSASARVDPQPPRGYQATTQEPGGVTPTDLARAVPRTDGDAPSASTAKGSDSGSSFVNRDLAAGFGFGLAVAILCALALVLTRSRVRVAHS